MPSTQVPALLGGFRLVESIGEGGMGVVFRAENVRVPAMVRAVKVIRSELAASIEFRERFLREAEYLELLQHPNILRVENIGEEDGALFMVMELLVGRSLEAIHLAKPRGLPVAQAVGLFVQALRGVGHAHQKGVIHRDLKPANLFVTDGGQVKTLDFGIARHGSSAARLTRTGQGMPGSPAYFAPEFGEGAEASFRSDVYAMGVSLYEVLAGQLPFQGGGGSEGAAVLSLMHQHVNKPLPDVRLLRPEVPEGLVQVLARAAAKDPGARFSEGNAFAEALAPFGEAIASLDAGTLSREAASRTRFALPGSAQSSSAMGEVSATRFGLPDFTPAGSGTGPGLEPAPRSRRRHAFATAAALVVLGALSAGYVLYGRGDQSGVSETAMTGVSHPGADDASVQPQPPLPPAPPGMVAIRGGTLHEGRPAYGRAQALDVSVHDVEVASFAIDKAEVTAADYKELVAAGHAQAPWPEGIKDFSVLARLPVINVSHDEAAAFCRWRHPKGGRLPTEAEWEWAARGPEGRLYPWGQAFEKVCVNALHGDEGVIMAADKHLCGATPEGVVDLSGNVWEWTSSPAGLYPGSEIQAAPGAGFFVIRGGSFYNTEPEDLTTTVRQFTDSKNPYLGFRCAADLGGAR